MARTGRHTNGRHSGKNTLDRLWEQCQVVGWRSADVPFTEIADRLKVSRTTAYRRFWRALDDTNQREERRGR